MSVISAGTTSTTAYVVTPDTTGNLDIKTGASNVTALTVDASQNVGIGTSLPAYKVDVTGQGRATTGWAVSADGSAFTPSGLNAIPNYGTGFITSGSRLSISGLGGIAFYTNQIERARIDASGNLLVGTTQVNPIAANTSGVTVAPAGFLNVQRTGAPGSMAVGNSTIGNLVSFYYTGAGIVNTGNISITGSTTAYGTSSDYRLKENVQPMINALSKIAALKPCTYVWKSTDEVGEGFIAHELQEVCPDAVTGEKDEVNEDGSIKPQGIDTSFLVATLTAAIQEQQAMIEELKAKVAALEQI